MGADFWLQREPGEGKGLEQKLSKYFIIIWRLTLIYTFEFGANFT